MLFAIVSHPRPEPPSGMRASRTRYWAWLDPQVASGVVRSIHARPGRGAVAIVDVESHDHLHRFLNEWAEIIPATFDLYPLIEPDSARRFLAEPAAS